MHILHTFISEKTNYTIEVYVFCAISLRNFDSKKPGDLKKTVGRFIVLFKKSGLLTAQNSVLAQQFFNHSSFHGFQSRFFQKVQRAGQLHIKRRFAVHQTH